ncbi:hypothetical protein AB2L37_07455, partial [Staphylococcus pseudintermedius]|uniref:hypothetical protein n=1 Tax=Staphylococcus pseudintermedius TaxID=283734 RepID=UPI003F97346B
LTVPTTKPVTDFHRQDVTHAGRTEKTLLLHSAELQKSAFSSQCSFQLNRFYKMSHFPIHNYSIVRNLYLP